jgi:thiamine biosynthesis lipoprotein
MKSDFRKLRLAAFILWALLLFSGCEQAPEYHRLEGGTMGTYYRVTGFCPGLDAVNLKTRLEAELAEVNDQMSTYQADSELMRFNVSPPGEWVPVSADLLAVLLAAREISELSAGAFDVTVSELVNLWGFGPDGRVSSRPSPERIQAAMALAGFEQLELDARGQRIRRLTPLTVDLSAIAKGHGVDRLSEQLRALGCEHYLVDIGGEVRARGQSPSGRLWRVGVEVPDPERMGSIQRVLALDSVAVATSGDYRNFLDLEGARYSHTIDPRTGHPVQHGLASVTVVHDSTMRADGLATALNVLGPEEGFALAEAEELAALFLVRRPNGFEERYTSAMLNHLAAVPES